MRQSLLFLAAILLLLPARARADELKLKDGSTIVGTIVAFEENSFKVQTTYGFAIVQKDQVVAINMGDAAKKDTAINKSGLVPGKTSAPPNPAKSPEAEQVNSSKEAADSQSSPASMKNLETSGVARSAPIVAAPSKRSAPAPAPAVMKEIARSIAVPSLPVTVAQPSKPPPPGPIREEVTGNTYANETFGFRMYKPPSWELIPNARGLLPGSIAAMGTADETTYLLIGQEPASDSLANDANATQQRLAGLMDNFRAIGEAHITVSGISAIERRFRGNVDQREWSGVAVFFPRDGQIFTIFGMTYAASDLVQIQENVLGRVISSIQFTKP
jgi:hypothetical protein